MQDRARGSIRRAGGTRLTMLDTVPMGAQARPVVVALHCSGAGPAQWQKLAAALGPAAVLSAPAYFGSAEVGPWHGSHAFTLADEAGQMATLARDSEPIHLVGHSYGGGLALHIAAHRPGRIASLALYEPSAFHLLRLAGAAAAAEFAEIAAVSRRTAGLVATGDCRGAAEVFVDYWSGNGAWDALRPAIQAALTRWMIKAPLDFHALIEETTPLRSYAALGVPILVLCGELAPAPTRRIARILADAIPGTRLQVVAGAGHMGPITHAETVATAIARHIATSAHARNATRDHSCLAGEQACAT